jgi:hypothetical protein
LRDGEVDGDDENVQCIELKFGVRGKRGKDDEVEELDEGEFGFQTDSRV